MITSNPKYYLPSGKAQLELRGLSSDTKPTGTYQGEAIGNGSVFLEIDTQNVSFYDEASNSWR